MGGWRQGCVGEGRSEDKCRHVNSWGGGGGGLTGTGEDRRASGWQVQRVPDSRLFARGGPWRSTAEVPPCASLRLPGPRRQCGF